MGRVVLTRHHQDFSLTLPPKMRENVYMTTTANPTTTTTVTITLEGDYHECVVTNAAGGTTTFLGNTMADILEQLPAFVTEQRS
jgi:hypothetical protein